MAAPQHHSVPAGGAILRVTALVKCGLDSIALWGQITFPDFPKPVTGTVFLPGRQEVRSQWTELPGVAGRVQAVGGGSRRRWSSTASRWGWACSTSWALPGPHSVSSTGPRLAQGEPSALGPLSAAPGSPGFLWPGEGLSAQWHSLPWASPALGRPSRSF